MALASATDGEMAEAERMILILEFRFTIFELYTNETFFILNHLIRRLFLVNKILKFH